MAMVTITKGEQEAQVTERSFERVWKKEGWKKKEPPKKSTAPSSTQVRDEETSQG